MAKIRDTHLLRDWKLVRARIARPFIVACFRGYHKQISACRTEQHVNYVCSGDIQLVGYTEETEKVTVCIRPSLGFKFKLALD
jgi:hypothetical protein